MTTWIYPANKSTSKLAVQLNQADSTMTLLDGSTFPSTYPYICNVNGIELVRVTNKTGNVFTITRSQEGTTAPTSHLVNKAVTLVLTAASIQQLQTEIDNINHGINNIQTVTGTYVADPTVATIYFCDGTSAAFTITLPTASSSSGVEFTLKKTDTSVNIVTIKGNGTELIDDANTYLLELEGEFVKIVSNGTKWMVTSE